MNQWESQIRTNLDDNAYAQCLGKLLKMAPGTLGAALVNTHYQEGHVELESGRAADEQIVADVITLAAALFANEPAADRSQTLNATAAHLKLIRPLKSVLLALQGEKILMQWLTRGRTVLVVIVGDALNIGAAQSQMLRAANAVSAGKGESLQASLQPIGEILASAVVDTTRRAVIDIYRRYDDISVVNLDEQLASVVSDLFSADANAPALLLNSRQNVRLQVKRAQLTGESRTQFWARMSFDPDHLMMVTADQKAIQGLVWIAINHGLNNIVRLWVDGLLNYGIETAMEPFPRTQVEFLQIVDELRRLDVHDLTGRLVLGGFANYTVGEGENQQRCQECIYYLPHAKWCDLPELPIPVEAHWWCRLWKL
jgi:hypothetical protein